MVVVVVFDQRTVSSMRIVRRFPARLLRVTLIGVCAEEELVYDMVERVERDSERQLSKQFCDFVVIDTISPRMILDWVTSKKWHDV